MPESIFSAYQGGKNRVTSAILAVFRSISIELTETILSGLLSEDIKLVHFKNQVAEGGDGVPDALISARSNILIETKIWRGAMQHDRHKLQLENHVARISDDDAGYLLVLTPDHEEPQVISQIENEKIRWASFGDFDQIIASVLSDDEGFVSERDEFLLRNLSWLISEPSLDLLPRQDACIVAARRAWPQYKKTGFYHCPTSYNFRPVEYFGFYADQAIQPKLARVIQRYDAIVFSADFEDDDRRLCEYVRGQVENGRVSEGESRLVIKLSECESPETKTLNDNNPIPHNQRGRGRGFTRGKRYVALEKLLKAQTTEDLMD